MTEVDPAQDAGTALTVAVSAAIRGDELGFRNVYLRVQPGLLRYLRVLVGAEAEDVAAETWLHIVRDLPSFTGNGDAFRAWAVTIARNRALDHLRAKRRRPVVDAVVEEVLVDQPAKGDTAEAALSALATETAIALIAALPRDQAEAVMLRVVVGLDANSAARVLGKRPGAVRTAVYRGLRQLAEMLATTAVESLSTTNVEAGRSKAGGDRADPAIAARVVTGRRSRGADRIAPTVSETMARQGLMIRGSARRGPAPRRGSTASDAQ